MRVVANSKGYFGAVREAGEEFEVPDGTKGSWFAPVAVLPEKAPGKGAKRPVPEPHPLGDEAADAI